MPGQNISEKRKEAYSLLAGVQQHVSDWFSSIENRPVQAIMSTDEMRRLLGGPLPDEGIAPEILTGTLAEAGMTGTVASAGPRYFGFVVGGSLPVAVAADWLVSAWDQNAGIYALSPLNSVIEQITGSWLLELAGLRPTMSFGFVTGGHMANFTGLAAARHRVLRDAGWDVEADGLFGAPSIDVVVSEEAHYTISTALRLLGLGANRVRRIPTDGQGRMRADELAVALRGQKGPCIVCAQAGNVNTGAFDPLEKIAEIAKNRGAWLHVDGAFGLWAAASPQRTALVRGIEKADSVATDAHKWLNVPYDCGVAFCSDEAAHRSAMSLAAAYIVATHGERDPHEFTPEESRRARAIPLYAAVRSLGRRGIGEMIERNCRQARRFADALRNAGHAVLNDVVLNQVLVSFGTTAQTNRTIAAIQEEGTCWCGGTVWKGRTAMRISVSNWSTTDEDIDMSAKAVIRVARNQQG
ncbi:MAG: aspartate aminotransferase family protein [Acidobacteriota bacterium]|nr:aspartate aminotransferase family protein [Acidobacteriota bacterium]